MEPEVEKSETLSTYIINYVGPAEFWKASNAIH